MINLNPQKGVIDMMITAHSVLRDRYVSRALFFEVLLLIASSILNALLFVDVKFIEKYTWLSADGQKLVTGIACLTVFTVSIVLLKVAWKEKSSSHASAAEQLFSLKQECRKIIALPDDDDKVLVVDNFKKKYAEVMSIIVKIPDNQFNSLKLIHKRKIELSRLIDNHPGSRLWILKLKMFYASFKKNQ